MKRIAGVVVVLAVVVVALWYWRGRSDEASRARSAAVGATGKNGGSHPGGKAGAPFADPRTQAKAAIRGFVRDPDGSPLAGATVCTTWGGPGLVDADTREPRCTTSEPSGAYALTALVPTWHQVTASAVDHQPRSWKAPKPDDDAGLELEPGEQRTGIDFVLPIGGVPVAGVVEDVSGGPIAGALVWTGTGGRWSRDRAGVVHTDAQGRFTVWTRAGVVSVEASAEGYAPGETETAAPSALVHIYLTPESTLSGTVVDGSGAPVADATAVTDGWGDGQTFARARTDAQGNYRLTRLAPGRYKPKATADRRYGEPAESVLLGLGQSVDGIRIPVAAASMVRGKVVVDRGDGKLEPGKRGWISLHDPASERRQSTGVEDDGSFALKSVLPGSYNVALSGTGFMTEDRYPAVVVVAGQDVDGLTWTVRPGASLVGTVKRPDGTPVEDVWVSARSTGGGARAQTGGGFETTDAAGKYELEGLIAGDYMLRVMSDGDLTPSPPPRVTVAAGARTTFDIVFAPSGTIAGTVVDTEGTPVPGVGVEVGRSVGAWGGGTTTGDDGTFKLDGVEPGVQRVTASRGWFAPMRKPGATDDDQRGETVKVVAGETATVRLVVEAQTGVIEGIVVDGEGEPVVDAWIMATRESDRAGAAAGAAMRGSRWSWGSVDRPNVTGTDGRFAVTKLSAGTYTLRAYRRGGGEAVTEHVALGADTKLTIPSMGSVTGVVVTADGKPPEEVEVALSNPRTGFERTENFFRTGGKFVLRDLPAGDLVVSADGLAGHAESTLTLGAGEDKTGVTITLVPKLQVTGRFVDLDTSAPVAGLRASVSPVRGNGGGVLFGGNDSTGRVEISGDDGRFTVDNAPTGLVSITGVPQDFASSRHGIARWISEVTGGPLVDLGDIPVARRRYDLGDKTGDLGLSFVDPPPDQDPRVRVLTVAHARPGGPAARAGVVAGDVVIAIDGHDVEGQRSTLASPLLRVKVGTTVALTLARGTQVQLTAVGEQ